MPRQINMFQRRHLEALAAIVADIPGVTDFERRNIAAHFAYRLRAAQSPGVNVSRFIAAATVVESPTPPPAPAPAPAPQCADCSAPSTHRHRRGSGGDYFCESHAMSCCSPL